MTRLWEDVWLGDKPVCVRFNRFYNLGFSKNILVSDVFETNWYVIRFRRNLWGETASM